MALLVSFEVDADGGELALFANRQAIKHGVVVCVGEDEALDTLEELRLVIFYEGGNAATACTPAQVTKTLIPLLHPRAHVNLKPTCTSGRSDSRTALTNQPAQ